MPNAAIHQMPSAAIYRMPSAAVLPDAECGSLTLHASQKFYFRPGAKVSQRWADTHLIKPNQPRLENAQSTQSSTYIAYN